MKSDIGRATLVLSIVWLFTGLTGHQPWKPDEAYSMGLAYSIAQGGSWVVPTLAGEPFMEKPPVFYLLAAGSGTVFSHWLPFHDGARLAAGLFTAVTLSCVAWAARIWWGAGSGAVLALIACFGLLVHAHLLLTDVGLLAGFALAYLGFALYESRPRLGALALGTGAGLGFMTKGLLEPGTMAVTAMALPVVFQSWRSAAYFRFLLQAALWASPWIVIWPALLWHVSSDLFTLWFWVNNFGRFLGFAGLGPEAESWAYARILPWFAWPALPLAVWVSWKERHRLRESPALQVCMTGFVATLVVLSTAHDARALYALPLLIPLALLGARFGHLVSSRPGTWIRVSGVVVYAGLAALVWAAWLALQIDWPHELAQWMNRQQPGFVPEKKLGNLLVGVTFSTAWLAGVYRVRRDPNAPVFAWAAGITLVWALCAILLLSWVDAGKSYRAMMGEASSHLPTPLTCLATRNLGEPQRALVHYYLGMLPHRTEIGPAVLCNALLVQIRGAGNKLAPVPQAGWTLRWEGARPGDEKERFWLYVRE